MTITTTELFLLAMLVIYVVPFAIWRLLKLEQLAPLAVVQIVGGVLLGPGVVGTLMPEMHKALFNPTVIMALNGVAWWGVMVFVFLAGLELDLTSAWANRRETGITASLALIVPLFFGSVAALFLISTGQGWAGTEGEIWQVVAGVGMACAVTALPILVLLLENLGILRTDLGQRILRYASADDVAIWSVLALILLAWERLGRQTLFIAGFIIAAFLIRKLFTRLRESDRLPLALAWLIICAFAADWAGLHYMVGAFLSGMVLEARWFGIEKLDQLRHATLLLLMPVFFLSTGLRTTWDIGGLTVFAAAALLLFASIAGKLAGVSIAARILKWKQNEAYVIGWLLQTKALIMIVFANVLLDKKIISSDLFTALLLMAVASTVLTTPMVRNRLKKLTQV